ncbi:beta-lactamase family protein [Schleiferiaceae bacterium]|jgi:CubicO group peptidase (beta-lactamase class C family)|nr:beta-lactamase family protein [Schleiferiaceae bacterium]MDB2539389.1 beta-lactamase family protein [Schleiferiaceae bacterium]MDC0118996.1 beta-lactamase family protein [Schleiferiaceae bacterium]MDC3183179.1 beta-lactamase family protein [Schleiferiaceae bacterium]HAQ71601.1 serine hydrolase [Flavobacteriales bacterium]
MHRKQNVLVKAFVFLILTSFAATLSSCSQDLIYFPKSIQEEVDKTLDNGYDGIIVCVNQNGQSKLYTSGWNNREDQIPADPHLLFKIASISKLYIAAATVKLIQDEQLSLNQTLAELITEVADKIEYADEITLEIMLQHRSGIPEFIYHPEFANSDPEESYLETANLIFNNDADFKPGKKYRYSNTNYLLIGEILDRTLGYSHHDYIKSEILQPLHLENTYNLLSEVDSSRVMSGYYVGYDEDLKMNDYTRPGGSMIATAEDVSIFLRALIDGSLLNEQEQAIYSSVYEYEHTGWLNGYTSIARYENDIDAVIVQFVNTSKGEMFWLGLERSYSRILKAVRK